jgi:ACS family hexuronate transporter-like MFS transporter
MALSRGRAWLVAVVATLAMSVSYVDRQVMAAIGASVRAALHIDMAGFGWLASAFSLSYLVAAPLAGAVVDRVGARRGLVAAIVLWSTVAAAHALAPSLAVLIALRVALGAAESPSFPAAAQSVRRALPASDRSAAYGLIFTGSSFGAAVAAPLALWLDVRFGWQAAFVVTAILGTAWVPLWLAVTRPREVRDALARASAEPTPRAMAVPATSYAGLLADPMLWRALLLVLASAPGLMFMFVWMPQYFELGRGVARAALGRYVWLPPVMTDVGMVGFGALASRLDRRSAQPRSHVELVLLAAALESLLVLVPRTPGVWPAVLAVGLSSAGGGGLYTLLTADLMSRVHAGRVSTAGGLCAAAQSLVYIVLNPVVGRWIDVSHSFDGPLRLLGGVALPGAIGWALWPVGVRRAPVTADSPDTPGP